MWLSDRTDNPPWLFAPLATPGGIYYWGFSALLIPYLLRKHGVSVDRIAGVSAIGSIPFIWYFLWSPVVDLGLRRRTWLLTGAGLAALCAVAAVLESAGSLALVTVFVFAGNVATTLGSSALGALMSTVHPSVRGRASGWSQAGNVGIGSLAGGASIWLADAASLPVLALICAAALFLPALAALLAIETKRPRLAAASLFSALFRDVWDVLRAGRTWIGLLYFASPVGIGALGNLISSVGPDYHASAAEIGWIAGAAGGALMGIGGLAGGYLCDRVPRVVAYAIAGFLAGVCGVWLGWGPATPATYGVGYGAYAFSTGIAYAAYTALVLEVLGKRPRGAATGYSLLNASGSVPIVYMTWLDGAGYKRGGARGLMGVDAASNLVGGVVLLLVARYYVRRWGKAAVAESPLAS